MKYQLILLDLAGFQLQRGRGWKGVWAAGRGNYQSDIFIVAYFLHPSPTPHSLLHDLLKLSTKWNYLLTALPFDEHRCLTLLLKFCFCFPECQITCLLVVESCLDNKQQRDYCRQGLIKLFKMLFLACQTQIHQLSGRAVARFGVSWRRRVFWKHRRPEVLTACGIKTSVALLKKPHTHTQMSVKMPCAVNDMTIKSWVYKEKWSWTVKLEQTLNVGSLQRCTSLWPYPYDLMNLNYVFYRWSWQETIHRNKHDKQKGSRDKEEREGRKNKAATSSSGGWREPSLLVKEELFHPAITESLSPH